MKRQKFHITLRLVFCLSIIFQMQLVSQTALDKFKKLSVNHSNAEPGISSVIQDYRKITEDQIQAGELHILAKTVSSDQADSVTLIDFYNLMGAYYESVSDYNRGMDVLQKALALNRHQYPEKEIFSLNYVGYIFWHTSKYDSAFHYHQRAIQIALQNNSRSANLAFAYLMLGNDYFDTGDYVKTSENYFESLRLYEKLADTTGLIMAHNRLCKMYYKLKDFRSANNHLFLSQKLNRYKQYNRETAFSYNSLGNIHIENNTLDSALFCFTETFRLYQSTGDKIGQSIASINLGDTYYAVYMKTKRRLFSDSSYLYYQKSLTLNKTVDNKFGMIYGWWGMGDNLVIRSETQQALAFYHQALQMSKQINAKSEEANLYWKIYQIYETNNLDSSYFYLKNYLNAKVAVENEERTKDLLRQESKYQIEKRIAEETVKMEHQNLLNAEKNKWKNYALAGVVVISLVLCYLVVISIKRMKIIVSKNELINSINQALSSQHQEITDSINYARHIQNAILPSVKELHKLFPDSFILYKPKNIVAGDFYWLEKSKDVILLAAADCTGHGVPGAMVSVICNNGLNRSVREYGLSDPGSILDKTREIVIQEFEKSDEEVKDGMDISLIAIKADGENRFQLNWAGANNPLWIVRKNNAGVNDLQEIKPDRQPIGKHTESKPFTSHSVQVKSGDCIYLFTDGYADQFGGTKGKKFMGKNLRELLAKNAHLTMAQQKEILENTFAAWKGNLEQVDDVCIIGIRI